MLIAEFSRMDLSISEKLPRDHFRQKIQILSNPEVQENIDILKFTFYYQQSGYSNDNLGRRVVQHMAGGG